MWGAVNDANNPDGWVSDCGLHDQEVGTRQRTRTCRNALGTDTGQPLCKVNTADLETTAEHTLRCVGPSELMAIDDQNFVKFCERLIETEPVFCPCK